MEKEIQRYIPSISRGLEHEQVQQRQADNLINHQPKHMTKSNWKIIKNNVFTSFNIVNLLIGIAIALVGSFRNLFYLAVIALNISIGIIQEIHAKNMVEKLSLLSTPKAQVIRGGKEQQINIEELVLDDVMVLESGMQIPSDSIIISGEIEVNESMLTGEADTIYKKKEESLFSGSFVQSGRAYAKVEHIGEQNFATKITKEARAHKALNSKLMNSYKKVTKFTTIFIIPIGIILFWQAYFMRSDSMAQSVVSTSAALLGMLPKGLMLLTSIALALSVVRLSKKKILVQELYCIETLAHVDVLCLDKTGTLTEGKMEVQQIIPIEQSFLSINVQDMLSSFSKSSNDNNSTFLAIKNYAKNYNNSLVPTSTVPFSSQRKWSSVHFKNFGTIILGAPEVLLENDEKTDLPEKLKKAQDGAARILLMAYSKQEASIDKLPELMIPMAWVQLTDIIRKDVKNTLNFFKQEGVDIKIISGDHPKTVAAIAREVGIEDYDSYIDARSLKNEDDIKQAVRKYSIFGRVMPHQKRQLLKALKQDGHTVAMTGDGVNDVLALKEADCSIAMASGSDAARQVSQIVLMDSNFKSLPDVLNEGRNVVNNTTRSASIFYLKTVYSMILSVISIFFQMPFPFIPIQITLIDLAIEGWPSFALTFEKNTKKIQGNFLFNVFSRAIPSAILVIINILIVKFLTHQLNISALDSITLMYYLLAFCGIVLVFRNCMPLNAYRLAVFLSVLIGFYVAAILFRSLLEVSMLNTTTLPIFLILAVLNYPTAALLSKILEKISSIFNQK